MANYRVTERITIETSVDNTIQITSNKRTDKFVIAFDKIADENQRLMLALAHYLGYDSSGILCFDEEEGEY